MKTQITFAALLPALASFIPLHAHASSTSEDEMIVTGNTAADTTDSAAGAGFKTNDIDVGPLGTKSWIETPYSSTTVTKEMIENQQAQSVSEMLKYSPSTQMQARGGMDVGRPQSRGMQGVLLAIPPFCIHCPPVLASLSGPYSRPVLMVIPLAVPRTIWLS